MGGFLNECKRLISPIDIVASLAKNARTGGPANADSAEAVDHGLHSQFVVAAEGIQRRVQSFFLY